MYSLTYVIVMVLTMSVMAAPISPTVPNIATTIQKIDLHHPRNLQQRNRTRNNASLSANLSASSLTLLPPTLLSSSPSPPAASSVTNNNTAMRLNKSHRKRYSTWCDYNENSTTVEWSNPCGGVFDPNATKSEKPTKREKKEIYNILRNTAINDYSHLNSSRKQEIEIDNIKIWWLHNYSYKFLPKLKKNSSVALKRWYRNMQTYVGTFSYLRRIQLKWDHLKSQRESSTAAELKELLKSARNMLCELEAAINRTHSYKGALTDKHISAVTRIEMNKRLKLRTKKRLDLNPQDLHEADSIDLIFVKYHYFEYLKNMWQILRRSIKRKAQVGNNRNGKKRQQNSNTQFNEIEKRLSRGKRRKNSKTKHRLE